MIINEDIYECPKCNELYFFNTAQKPYTTNCSKCKCGLIFLDNADRDTEYVKSNTPPYDPTTDPNSPYYIAKVTCPYCQSTNTKKIGVLGRSTSISLFGLASGKVGKQWHCNSCKSDF